MSRKQRNHLEPVQETDNHLDGDYQPKSLSKQEFARRLHHMILERGWNQSELARRSGIGRDAVSTYVRGRSFPEAKTLRKISQALGVEPTELLPNTIETAIEEDEPALSIREAAGHPDKVWLKVNRMATPSQALRVMQILHETDENADPA